MKLIDKYQASVHKQKVIDFWNHLHALPSGVNPEDRVKEVIYVAQNEEGQVIGVTTAVRNVVKKLNNSPMFLFRTLIHPTTRIPGLVDKLAVETKNYLQDQYLAGKTDCIGIIAAIQNKQLMAAKPEAVWPSTGLTFIGNNKDGSQIRVVYFEKAKISI
ncbi:hypothetical protein [Fulvivirga ligni]|uniref:hypothetical protein n=1 Tax=Fulvivirga ligni TaxID=2904246 RepID=UPI001F1CA27A|nr:hypothetical protein [Fulvivirga ligni]UII23801.1 hypothetical protein LVD16_11265 [Fulvivirga ligni]